MECSHIPANGTDIEGREDHRKSREINPAVRRENVEGNMHYELTSSLLSQTMYACFNSLRLTVCGILGVKLSIARHERIWKNAPIHYDRYFWSSLDYVSPFWIGLM